MPVGSLQCWCWLEVDSTEYGPGEKWWTLFKQRHPQLALLRFRSDSDSDNNDGAQYVDVTN